MYVVTIDGPAGAGKSTVAAKVARSLRLVHLNSGLIFRVVAFKLLQRGVDLSDKVEWSEALKETLEEISIDFRLDEQGQTLFLLKDLVEQTKSDFRVCSLQELSTEEIGLGASKIALLSDVREFACRVQRKISERQSVVVEGRDAGSVIFPKADFKFYLSASVQLRALRRFNQLHGFSGAKAKGLSDLSAVENEELARICDKMQLRDNRDSQRVLAPTKIAGDAVVIETSNMTADEVVECIIGKINNQPLL